MASDEEAIDKEANREFGEIDRGEDGNQSADGETAKGSLSTGRYNSYKKIQRVRSAMPVDFDEYRESRDGADGLPTDPDSNAYEILSFLAERPELGFKPGEIGEHVDVSAGSLSPTLARLEERGLVEHESPYWSAGDDDRLAALTGTIASMRAFEDRHDDDEFDGWHDTDVDPRTDR